MKNKGNGNSTEAVAEVCDGCHQYFDKKDECDGNYVPLTRDEEAILARMREVKVRVAEVRKQLKDLECRNGFQPPGPERSENELSEEQVRWLAQTQQMSTLREEWQDLDEKRQEAAAFRMKILGHED